MKKVSSVLILKISSLRYHSYFRFENIVNEESIKKTLSSLKRIQLPKLHQSRNTKIKAAVLIPVCIVNDKTSLLYTLRTSHLRSHKGQVSFPGGKHDTKDESLEHTAIRETVEEIGIDPTRIRIWGTGSALLAGESYILPVIGHIMNELDIKQLSINKHEVEEVFSVSLENLCDPNNTRYTQFRDVYSTPVFLGGQRRIWGLTAILTHIFLKSVFPINVYNHKIQFIKSFKVNDKQK